MNCCFTCITGNYDILQEPLWKDKDWRFICFSDENINSNGWEIIKVPKQEDKKRLARSIKILPTFPFEVDNYFWVDANIAIVGDLNTFINPLLDHDLSVMRHPHRTTLDQEVEACLKYKKDDPYILGEQLLKYKQNGYVSKELAATGIIFRKQNPLVNDHAKFWLEQIKQYSHRDQMSFNYSCWKTGLQPNYFPYDVIDDGVTFKYSYHPHRLNRLT